MDFTPLLVIPAIVCLFAITMHWLLASQTQTFRILVLLYLSLILTMFADVMGHPILRYDALAYILVQFAAPSIIPLSCLYFLAYIGPLLINHCICSGLSFRPLR